MTVKSHLVNIARTLFLLIACSTTARAIDFDVKKYGGKANSDITQAVSNAWKDACASSNGSKIIIAAGTYQLREVSFLGPCKGPIEFFIQGTLQGPEFSGKGDSWITFERVDKLALYGGGTFDGIAKYGSSLSDGCNGMFCANLPINLRFNFISNSTIRDITSKNSKQFHVNVFGCNNVMFQEVTIIAPAYKISSNTNGIHIAHSTNINVTDSNIGNGDDCISIGDGSREVTISKVNCGHGHGISIKSLGKYENEEPIEGIRIKNCTLNNTKNRIRIKSWPSSFPGLATEMYFEDIIVENVGNPILIDQEYCPWNECKMAPSKVKVKNASFKNTWGGSNTPLVKKKLVSSKDFPCENVELLDINLTYNGNEGIITSLCKYVQPKSSGTQTQNSPPYITKFNPSFIAFR